MTNGELVFRTVVLPTKSVRAQMKRKVLPEFEMRHRMELALEYGSVSVNEMARQLGVSRTTISNYLHGRTQPRRGDLIAWAMRCGVPFDWLVGADSEHVLDDDEPAAPPEPPKQRRRRKSA
jgi:transcriptional regulator with XRE-family HTH domain